MDAGIKSAPVPHFAGRAKNREIKLHRKLDRSGFAYALSGAVRVCHPFHFKSMIKATLLACLSITQMLLLAGAAGAQSIEAARMAQAEGRFIEAAGLAEALKTSEGYALAAESLAIQGHYIAGDDEKKALLKRAMGLAQEAVRLDATNPQAHLQLAHAMGRYAQAIGVMKAARQGYAGDVRRVIEDALALDPEMAAAHLSLAAWHAEAIHGGGLMAKMVYGASKKLARAHYERAFELAPEENVVLVEYAHGLLLLNHRKNRERARDLLLRVIKIPSKSAHDHILHQRAVEELAGLDSQQSGHNVQEGPPGGSGIP